VNGASRSPFSVDSHYEHLPPEYVYANTCSNGVRCTCWRERYREK
jgi:hypothetical protein